MNMMAPCGHRLPYVRAWQYDDLRLRPYRHWL
jgi:hypothetical protein